jgi:hypothetical protein
MAPAFPRFRRLLAKGKLALQAVFDEVADHAISLSVAQSLARGFFSFGFGFLHRNSASVKGGGRYTASAWRGKRSLPPGPLESAAARRGVGQEPIQPAYLVVVKWTAHAAQRPPFTGLFNLVVFVRAPKLNFATGKTVIAGFARVNTLKLIARESE